MQQIFENLIHVDAVNQTFLALVPKVDSPESFVNFRPIGLCNVTYKLVTKTIATRMKDIMQKLISDTQCNFLLGRQSADNILVA